MTDLITGPAFVADRAVPPEWAAQLARLTPVSERVPWLMLVWMPGELWDPVQRWVLYEMFPDLEHVPEWLLGDIRQDDPSVRGQWIHDDGHCGICGWLAPDEMAGRVHRYCPGWDGTQHPVENPDGKQPGELCNDCIDLRERLAH